MVNKPWYIHFPRCWREYPVNMAQVFSEKNPGWNHKSYMTRERCPSNDSDKFRYISGRVRTNGYTWGFTTILNRPLITLFCVEQIWQLLKDALSQIGSFPQVEVKIKHVWNHHLDPLYKTTNQGFEHCSKNTPRDNSPNFKRQLGVPLTVYPWYL